jgi:HlyD family secretion protein
MRTNRRMRLIIGVVLLLVLVVAGGWYRLRSSSAASNALIASGTIETSKVRLSPEVSGVITEMLVREGQQVKAGDVLVKIDDTAAQAQYGQAQAALTTAQANLSLARANYDLVAAGPTAEQRQVNLTGAQLELLNAQKALDDLHNNAALQAAAAYTQIAQAQKALDTATKQHDSLVSGATQADIDSARATVVLLKDQLDKAKEDYAPYANKPEDNLVRAALLNKLSTAQKAYDNAVTRLNNLLGVANALDLDQVEASLQTAQAQLADAQRRYAILKDGPDPQDIAQAEAQVAAAQAHLAAAQADPSQQQLDLAEAQVESARTALGVIQSQLDKLVLKAPSDGTVLSRNVEPGEVVSPGAPLLTIARLDDLTLTIFVPEDSYGAINLGEAARVTVDSFPGQVFTATVDKIADQAEFTPRNVQTAEGRRTTVFAVKLKIANPDGRLKPGMPADVTFGN